MSMTPPTLLGIDVSNRQGDIEWPKVRGSGIDFAMIKSSEGVKYVNELLLAFLAGALASDVATGLYHFVLPAWNAPADEAAHLLSVVRPVLRPGMPVAIDVEPDPYGRTIPADCGPWLRALLAIVEPALGFLCMIYTNLDLIRNHGLGAPDFATRGLWYADPGVQNPATPAPWTLTAMQQTSWTGTIDGISVPCDEDVFFGGLDQFHRYGAPAVTPRRRMTNDDWTYAQRVMLANNSLNPVETAAFLGLFDD